MDRSSASVLVVDDDEAFRDLVGEVLAERGFLAVRASNGLEALERLAEGTFAAAVVDLMMPGLGGLELAERVRERSPDTQIVILTGEGGVQSMLAGLRRGIFDYLQKGQLDTERLGRSVEDAVERWRLLRHNRELMTALLDSNRLLRAIHASSASIVAEAHLDRLLSQLVASGRDLCRAATARVMLFEQAPDGERVVWMAEGPGAETLRGMRLHPGAGLVTLALERKETLLLPDPRGSERFDARCDELPTDLPGLLVAPLLHRDVRGVLIAAGSQHGAFTNTEQEALSILAGQAAVAVSNGLQHERSLNFFTHASDLLVEFIEAVDVDYPGHSRGVALLADMVTRRLGLAESERRNIHFGALLHDIGKLRVPAQVIRAAGPLSPEARRAIEQHPRLGAEILRQISQLEEIQAIVHAHHERWDGKGYPRGLKGEEIPLGARIVAIAEVYDVMARDTPHPRERLADPIAEIEACSSTQFDPRIVRLFAAELRQHGDPRRP
jgi:putative nucleotidyltransferase with HDIG domain